jgi:hypothetical protein
MQVGLLDFVLGDAAGWPERTAVACEKSEAVDLA